jgi:uncharacterized protein YcbX
MSSTSLLDSAGEGAVRVARLTVYPVKSLDGVDVPSSRVLASGALEQDRRWAMIDGLGNFVNAKRTPRLHELAATFDLARDEITIGLRGQGPGASFSLARQSQELSDWLSDFFEFDVRLVENTEVGHPDDPQAPGPTILSTETLFEIASWFDLPLAQVRRRFRANIELSATAPFWEDRLFGAVGQPVQFRVGEMIWEGSNPCARCVVPTRDPDTGVARSLFSAEFVNLREATLPPWAERSRFDHFYRLAVNTRPVSGSGRIAVGDAVERLP